MRRSFRVCIRRKRDKDGDRGSEWFKEDRAKEQGKLHARHRERLGCMKDRDREQNSNRDRDNDSDMDRYKNGDRVRDSNWPE